ncbi:MAG: GAF domain-containing protein [Rhodospirillales bacterium]|nr:GAF domain-containing protein [Rhodospirillales bacterium]MBO6787127.1 GAF domain-containing protein [Rhodospirillales bacterium]
MNHISPPQSYPQSYPVPDAHIEAARLAKLHTFGILDTEPEPAFTRVTELVQDLFRMPISAISLVDAERQWFKAASGLPTLETPRYMAFCAHAIMSDDVMIVQDASEDRRFSTNRLVLDWPGIRFYAGAPLITHDGYRIGALCAIDYQPRDLTEAQEEKLRGLAQIVVDEIELNYGGRNGVPAIAV